MYSDLATSRRVRSPTSGCPSIGASSSPVQGCATESLHLTRRPHIGVTTQLPPPGGVGSSTHEGAQKCWRLYAYAVAAARDDTPNLANMLLTCRSIVLPLRVSSSAIALLVPTAATRRSTCSSRGVRPSVSAVVAANAGAGKTAG